MGEIGKSSTEFRACLRRWEASRVADEGVYGGLEYFLKSDTPSTSAVRDVLWREGVDGRREASGEEGGVGVKRFLSGTPSSAMMDDVLL
jgi:hypothetical protein